MSSASSYMLSRCFCTRARTAARLVARAYDDVLRPSGLKASQLAVLAAVDSAEAASIAELSNLLFMDRTTLSRNLKPLLAGGLVSVHEAGSGRSKAVEITRAGNGALKAALALWSEAQAQLQRRHGEPRLAAMDRQLQHFIASYTS